MNIYNCITGESLLVSDANENRKIEQTCFSRRCGNGCLTRCETRTVNRCEDEIGFAAPTCYAINKREYGYPRQGCCRGCCHRCCCRQRQCGCRG